MLLVVPLVGMTEFVLAATFLGIYTGMSRGFPTYCSIHTGGLALNLGHSFEG